MCVPMHAVREVKVRNVDFCISEGKVLRMGGWRVRVLAEANVLTEGVLTEETLTARSCSPGHEGVLHRSGGVEPAVWIEAKGGGEM
jgi:hypothetical protein